MHSYKVFHAFSLSLYRMHKETCRNISSQTAIVLHLAADLLTQVYCYTDTFIFFCAFHFSRMQQTPVVSLNGIFYQCY